jgi:hypothetical protein
MEINPSEDTPVRWVVMRSTPEPIVVNLPESTWDNPADAIADLTDQGATS